MSIASLPPLSSLTPSAISSSPLDESKDNTIPLFFLITTFHETVNGGDCADCLSIAKKILNIAYPLILLLNLLLLPFIAIYNCCFTGDRQEIRTYQGEAAIKFSLSDQKGLSVTIETDRLHMRSLQGAQEDYDHYANLFGNPEVVEKYATGQTKTPSEIKDRIDRIWAKRWRENNPYSAFAIFKKDTDQFAGHIILGHGDRPGESEFAGLGHKEFWQQGYGSEAAAAIIHEYAPAVMKEGYLLEGKPLTKIVATARLDNPATGKILEDLGMKHVGQEEKYGAMRNLYEMALNPS